MTQRFISVSEDDKRRALIQLLKDNSVSQAFVFVNSKLGCARLTRSLERDGIKATALHGDKSQDERLKALDAFKRGEVQLLVCTDVAARGLDIKDVPAVFNYDIPFNAEDYVHRIGRTGRAGASGLAISFATPHDQRLLGDVEKLIKKKAELEAMEFDEDRPRGRINTGRRHWGEDDPRDVLDRRTERQVAPRSAPKAQPLDPFFTQPYVAPDSNSATMAEPVVSSSRGSSNIKPKKKLAALFKAG